MTEVRRPPKAILFDFDGTISTLRSGWEMVMRPMMLEMINPQAPEDPQLQAMVDAYIDASTGIQTIYQMQWLHDEVARRGRMPLDPWAYKDEYNRRLMQAVSQRVEDVRSGQVDRERYLMRGSIAFLEALRARDVSLYVASGTDDADVQHEAEVLGVSRYFARIAGAPHRRADCSKEAVLRSLLQEQGIAGTDLAVVGDGKVEIALGCEVGARTLGVASDEERRSGVNPVKRERLQKAGAEWIIGDYGDVPGILAWLGL